MTTNKPLVHKHTGPQEMPEGPRSIPALLLAARTAYRKVRWLAPPSLDTSSTVFGRNIERWINRLGSDTAVVALNLRNKRRAVVMSAEHYDQMLAMKACYKSLIALQEQLVVEEAADDFDSLFARISSGAAAATATLLSSTEDEFNASYRPGLTESDK